MTAVEILVVNRNIKGKRKFRGIQCHNILKHFDILPNFPFTTNETMTNYD